MKRLEKYLSPDSDLDKLHRFAYLGNSEKLDMQLKTLAILAEKEEWTIHKTNDLLMNYLVLTFDKAFTDDLILISEDEEYACFNTGLMTNNGEDIICMFNRFNQYNPTDKYFWHLNSFRKESAREFLAQFSETPEVVKYYSNPSELYFDPSLEIVKNYDHIFEDRLDRFPRQLQEKGREVLRLMLSAGLEEARKRIKRNFRIVVPAYYNGTITYLLPVRFDNTVLPVAVEKLNSRYRVNTILTPEMAKRSARILLKPEADWL